MIMDMHYGSLWTQLRPNLVNEYPSSLNLCDKRSALKSHIAQYALDVVCITEQGERIKRGGRQKWREWSGVGGESEREGGCRKHKHTREGDKSLGIQRNMWGDFPNSHFLQCCAWLSV